MAQQSGPADYARNHWRKFESQEEHAERVEASETVAGRYFASATLPQLNAFNQTMAFLRPLRGPIWDRRRAAAMRVWERDTAAAVDLFNLTADEIMREDEASDATMLAWDALIDQAEQGPEPFPQRATILHIVHPEPARA